MNEIYVITTGGEDWKIIGYTDSEEEAIKICLEHNAKVKVFDNYYYSKARKINLESKNNITPIYNYEVLYVLRDNKWCLVNIGLNWYGEKPYETLVSKDRHRDDIIICLFNLPELDREKAKNFSYTLLQNFLKESKECE